MGFKKILLWIAIAVFGIVNILIQANISLYNRSGRVEDSEEKIKLLKRANRVYPFNDLVFYELGKAYFDLSIQEITNKAVSEAYLRKSIESFTHSIKINPASFFGHFYFAQSLLYMTYLSPSFDTNFYDEYKKAALLAGHNSQVFFEVGKIFLSKWTELPDGDREFMLEILKKIAGKREEDKLLALMRIWDLNVREYTLMEEILPEDAEVYRLYARFLGEKSLSIEIRQNMLARAEFMEFERAKREFRSGESELLYFRLTEAIEHFKSCLTILERITFYQNLTQEKLINNLEFHELNKLTSLNLAKCLIEQGKELKDAEGYLRMYLALEDEVAAIGELESYLRSRGLIEEKMEKGFSDLQSLAFQIFLNFKQNRYRNIMKVGQLLRESFIVVPEMGKASYVEILQFVADSYRKADYIYDALEFYQKALEIEPDNLTTLLKIRQNFERLNDEVKIRETNERLANLLAPKEMVQDSFVEKGQRFSRFLTLDGRKINLGLHFKEVKESGLQPMISVFFNGQVVWEDYLENKKEELEDEEKREGEEKVSRIISLSLKSEVGQNELAIVPMNRPVSLLRISVHFEE